MSNTMSTPELMERLRRHYIKPGPMPGGVFVDECGVNGMWGASSRCDALHVGFTSSSGRILTGHEVKVSRSDWLHELDQPQKADAWADQCHQWYLVTATEDIVQPGELPAGWGHMVPGRTKTRMRVLVQPTKHLDRDPSWGAVRSMMARLDTLQREALNQARRDHQATVLKAVAEELAEREARNESLGLVPMTEEQVRRLRAMEQLEQQLGVTVDVWVPEWDDNPGNRVAAADLGKALHLVRAIEKIPAKIHTHDIERALNSVKEFNEARAEWRVS